MTDQPTRSFHFTLSSVSEKKNHGSRDTARNPDAGTAQHPPVWCTMASISSPSSMASWYTARPPPVGESVGVPQCA